MPERELVLIRHGQARCNAEGIIASKTCKGLTETGRWQAEQLARWLRNQYSTDDRPAPVVYSSPVRRARETAQAIADQLHQEPGILDDLAVPNPGPHAEGRSWDDVRRRWPPDPGRRSRPLATGGERWADYLARTHACLSRLLNGIADRPAIVVAHSETFTAAYMLLIGVADLGALRVDVAPTGITRLTAVPERPNVPVAVQRWSLAVHNDIHHLAP
jgi:probable phosphoglycerate mutase